MNNYSTVETVNGIVNNSVTYKTDSDQYSRPEYWCEAGQFGDCEDYALLKRHKLLDAGWPIDKLSLACCWTETNEYHCVLLVDTDKGWFVLDNRHPFPIEPSNTGYRWDKALRGKEWHELSFA